MRISQTAERFTALDLTAALAAALPSNDNSADAVLDRSIVIAFGDSAEATYWKNSVSALTLGQMLEGLKHPDPNNHEKDGKAFVPGALRGGPGAGGKRVADNIEALEFLAVDFDNGRPFEPILDRADDIGLHVLVVPTFNNMRPETEIKTDALLKWIRDQKGAHGTLSSHDEATPEQVLAYFRARVLPEYSDGATFKGRRGRKYVVAHKPYPRFRVYIPLAQCVVLDDIAPTNAGAKEKWRAFYHYAANELLQADDCDKSCTDITRLFYLNRQRADADVWAYETRGKALDVSLLYGPIGAIPGAASNERVMEGGAALSTALGGSRTTGDGQRKEWKVEGLGRFASVCMEHGGFNGADFLRDYGHDAKENGRGGVEAYCLRQDLHSEEDADGKLTLYAYNADDTGAGAGVIKCNHNGCSQTATTWDHVDMIADGHSLTIDDLTPYAADPDAVRAAIENGAPFGPGVVIATADWETNVTNVKKALVERNAGDPKLFHSTFGGGVRVNAGKPQQDGSAGSEQPARLERVETQKRWRNEIESRVEYCVNTTRDENEPPNWVTRPLPRELIDRVSEDTELGLPEVERITALPSFAPDGTVQTENGYNPKLRTYLHSRVRFATPDEHPSDDLVAGAAAILDETLCEFCPTDIDGVDELPPRIGKDPKTGLAIPNPERGKSSRAVLEAT